MRAKFRNEMDDPSLEEPKIETDAANRPKLLSETDAPRCKKSTTDSDDPKRAEPTTANVELKRTKLRSDNDAPT